MKKRKYFIACIIIVVALVAGCIRQDNNLPLIDDGDANQPVGEAPTSITIKQQSTDTSDWKQTRHDVVNNLSGVSMTTKEGSVSSTKVTVIFENTSAMRYIYGSEFWLERKIDGAWYVVPVVFEGNYAFTTIGILLDPGDRRELAIDWGWIYGMLNPGEYRVLKGIIYSRSPGDYDSYHLAAEFNIAPVEANDVLHPPTTATITSPKRRP